MKKIAILGSTGSIGTQTLEVIRQNSDRFKVVALAAYGNDRLLEEQINEFLPEHAALVDTQAADRLRQRLVCDIEILEGEAALVRLASDSSADIVVTSMVGFAGLKPTVAAIEAGKDIALANKETLVVAGELIMRLAEKKGVKILPVDSEHSAIFQCLQGQDQGSLKKIILTCSGGPFRGKTAGELESVSIRDCLKHPNWAMGKKITTDCATLANKGLEVMEAHWLYGVAYDRIEVVVHPQSIVHSMIEFTDGAVIAQLGQPDMRLPIQYALTYPERWKAAFPKLDFTRLAPLTFEAPDTKTFRALALAYQAGREGGTSPCVFNGANEEAVRWFLDGKLSFLAIAEVIEKVVNAQRFIARPTLEDLFEADAWAREKAREFIL